MPAPNPTAATTNAEAKLRRSGRGEKEIIASQAKRIIFRTGYLVWPATRGGRVKRTAVCGKPTHATIPLKKRCVSRIARRASKHGLEMRRKSPVSGGKSR